MFLALSDFFKIDLGVGVLGFRYQTDGVPLPVGPKNLLSCLTLKGILPGIYLSKLPRTVGGFIGESFALGS